MILACRDPMHSPKIERLEAEIARLRGELDKAHRLCSQMLGWHKDYEIKNAKLRAALLKAKHGAEYPDELGDIIDKALANEEGR